MANFEENRIICSRSTAKQLITSEGEGYFDPIDFRKALGMEPYVYLRNDVSYGWGCAINELDDGRIDIGFCTRWFSNFEVINAFVSKYHDAEWWIN